MSLLACIECSRVFRLSVLNSVLIRLDCAAEYSPFYGIEKGAVLQEARCFNDPHIDPRRCQQVAADLDWHGPRLTSLFVAHQAVVRHPSCSRACLLHSVHSSCQDKHRLYVLGLLQVITKLLYLICQGESLTKVRS